MSLTNIWNYPWNELDSKILEEASSTNYKNHFGVFING